MFVKCLDKLLDNITEAGVDTGRIAAISGDAQVYAAKTRDTMSKWHYISCVANVFDVCAERLGNLLSSAT